MSASEKLKRLAVSEHPLSLPDQGDDHIGGTLHAVLPALIAVVEAAEAVEDQQHEPWSEEYQNVRDSLAALDDALGEEA